VNAVGNVVGCGHLNCLHLFTVRSKNTKYEIEIQIYIDIQSDRERAERGKVAENNPQNYRLTYPGNPE